MSWTYTGNPSATTVDQVRFLVGQVSSQDAILLTDEEITWANGQRGLYGGAELCALSMAGRYAAEARREAVGSLAVTYGNRAEEYRETARMIKRQAGQARAALPYAGGITDSDKEVDRDNTNMVQPVFARGMDDNSRIGNVDQPLSTSA